MAKERFTRCGSCGEKKIMTDELRREFNAKADSGKRICPDCKVKEIYERFGVGLSQQGTV